MVGSKFYCENNDCFDHNTFTTHQMLLLHCLSESCTNNSTYCSLSFKVVLSFEAKPPVFLPVFSSASDYLFLTLLVRRLLVRHLLVRHLLVRHLLIRLLLFRPISRTPQMQLYTQAPQYTNNNKCHAERDRKCNVRIVPESWLYSGSMIWHCKNRCNK